MNEEEFVQKYLLKLTNGNNGACNLQDDIARISCMENVIVNTDSTIQGVHILREVPVNFLAYKAMARAFSDILAKTSVNGRTIGYFLNIILPKNFVDFKLLVKGFEEFSFKHKCDLLGGDTSVYGGGDVIIVVTALVEYGVEIGENIQNCAKNLNPSANFSAEIPHFIRHSHKNSASCFVSNKNPNKTTKLLAKNGKNHLQRCNAKVGDGIFLTKQVGTAFLDFEIAKNWIKNGCNGEIDTKNEYLMPSLVEIGDFSKINASMDISDGLVKDARTMGRLSNVILEIDYDLLLSRVEITREMLEFGDDYNILMTTKQDFVENAFKIGIVRENVGENLEKAGVLLKNLPFVVEKDGFDHFL